MVNEETLNFVTDNEFLYIHDAFEYFDSKSRFRFMIGSSGRFKRLGHTLDTLFTIYDYDSAKLKGGGVKLSFF